MNIQICIPSYHRSNKLETLKYLPSAKIFVSADEFLEYGQNYSKANLISVHPKYQGNVCRIRNYILDYFKDDIVVILDDDLQYLGYFEGDESIPLLTEEEIYGFIYKYSVMAMDLGVKLWGINVSPDKQNYREYTPFSLTSYIGSPFSVHIKDNLRYDENLSLKEDYDFTLQHLNKYRKVLRVNKYFYNVRQMEQAGGVATYRNLEEELRQVGLLRKKWGSKIIRSDSLDSSRSHSTTKERKFDVNPILNVPIKGV